MEAEARIERMAAVDRVGEALQRSLPHLPAEARIVVEAMLTPTALAIITSTLAVWAGSQFFGVGEIVDLILLAVGVVSLGFAVFEGAAAMYDFAKLAVDAKSDADLDQAGLHFARAVHVLGISVIQALLLRGHGRAAVVRGRPKVPRRSSPAATEGKDVVTLAGDASLSEECSALFHDLVRRHFSPRTGPLRRLRIERRMSDDQHSALLAHLQDVLAEGYGQLEVHGLAKALGAYRFPLDGGSVTVASLAGEGQEIGTIALGGELLHVSITRRSNP